MAYLNNVRAITTHTVDSIIGLGFPFKRTTGGYAYKQHNLDTLLAGLKQILLTERGERVMQPEFGISLRRYLFDPITSHVIKEIRESIVQAINTFDNRIIIRSLQISGDDSIGFEDDNRIIIRLHVGWKMDPTQNRELEVKIS